MRSRIFFIVFIYFLPYTLLAQRVDRLILSRDYKAALELLDKEILFKQSADLYHKKGTIYIKLLEYEKAIRSFKAAYQLDTTYMPVLEDLAEISIFMGNHHGAIFYYQKAAQLAPDEIYWQGKLAASYIGCKDYYKAFELYSDIWKQDSINNFYKRNYALSAYRTDTINLAIKLYEELAELNYPDINVYLNLASIYLSKQDKNMMEKAINTCLLGLIVFPDHPLLELKQADTWFQCREYKNAQLIYEELRVKGKLTLEAIRNYGVCLFINGETEESLKIMFQCLDDGLTTDPIVYFYIGVAYKKQGAITESISFLESAIATAIPPYLGGFYEHIGHAYSFNRDNENAIDYMKKSLELNPDNYELIYSLAVICDRNSEKTLALNYYQTYLDKVGSEAKYVEVVTRRINSLKGEAASK